MKKLILILCVFFSGYANSAFMSGNELLEMCESKESERFHFQIIAECSGYVTGVYDHYTGTTKDGVLCLSGKITIGQIKKIFVSYANKNPEKLNKPADFVVESAIYQAFRCN